MDDTVRRDRHHFRFRAERPGPEPAAFEVQLRFRWVTAANFVVVRAVGTWPRRPAGHSGFV